MDKKVGYLKKDRQERYNLKRGWFVNAWRIVDVNGNDMIQPWCNTKKEAMETAKACGIIICGLYDAGYFAKDAPMPSLCDACQSTRDNGKRGGRPDKYTYSGYQAHLGIIGNNTCEIPNEVANDQKAYDGKTFPARVLTGYNKGRMMRVRLIGDDYGLNTSGTGDVVVRPVSLVQTARKGQGE